MRLIDADALMEELLKWNTEAVRTDNHINTIFSSGMIGIVRLSPTVDAVHVIRCKDCVYLSHLEDSVYSCCRTEDDEIELMDYCSMARRRDNGKTD